MQHGVVANLEVPNILSFGGTEEHSEILKSRPIDRPRFKLDTHRLALPIYHPALFSCYLFYDAVIAEFMSCQ